MDLIKKLFSFNNDESCAIGLCKFSDSFYKLENDKENFKKKISKNSSLSEILKRPI